MYTKPELDVMSEKGELWVCPLCGHKTHVDSVYETCPNCGEEVDE